ncbi:hypothetical protein BSQ38_03630 [Pediococcus damnosus]|uniref:hypothetical protein n=1 Tax=Pediococcus damnosus TaxID=51663 RepID=UPI000C1C8E33|nr:hypothetical protein [Pediococcus damnosus]PIO80799.1 hypothetical protein BSQ38_03630 [Pediococcus damnosus]
MTEISQWYKTVRPSDGNFPALMNTKTVSWYLFGNGGSQEAIRQLLQHTNFYTTVIELPNQSTRRFVKSKVDKWLAEQEGM